MEQLGVDEAALEARLVDYSAWVEGEGGPETIPAIRSGAPVLPSPTQAAR